MTSFIGTMPGAAVPGGGGAMPSATNATSTPMHFEQAPSARVRSAPIAFFNAQSISLSKCNKHKPATRLIALRHNRREIQQELGAYGHIDPTLSHLNIVLLGPGSAVEVEARALSLMSVASDVPKRKDYVQAIELLISLPEDADLDLELYFKASLAWACNRFGEESILAADVHHDEAAPHCHILVLPLKGNVWVGGKLLGGLRQLISMRDDFMRVVARAFGLRAPATAPRGSTKLRMSKQVLQALTHADDAVVRSAIWPLVQQQIRSAPLPFHEQLRLPQLEVPSKPAKTMAAIFTGTGKGPRQAPEPWRRGSLLADCERKIPPLQCSEQPARARDPRTHTCVGFHFNDAVQRQVVNKPQVDCDAATSDPQDLAPMVRDGQIAPRSQPFALLTQPNQPCQQHGVQDAQ